VLKRVQWGSLVTVILVLGALGATAAKQTEAGIVLALCAIAWAILSLKERP
jgi:hypothetical protein